MIFAVFTEGGDRCDLVQLFYDSRNYNIPYGLSNAEAQALIEDRWNRGISTPGKITSRENEYVHIRIFSTEQEFISYMEGVFDGYLRANEDLPDICNLVRPTYNDMRNNVATCDQVVEAYNKYLAEQDDLYIFYSLESFLNYLN